MSATPKASWPWVKTLLHPVYDQPDASSVHDQYDRLIEAITAKLPKVAAHLDAARADVLAFTGFPKELWRQIWSSNPQERLNREIRRRNRRTGLQLLGHYCRSLSGEAVPWSRSAIRPGCSLPGCPGGGRSPRRRHKRD